jgi:chromosome segregation ATPase
MTLNWLCPFLAIAFMEQLVAFGVKPGDQDSTTKSLAILKNELAEEKLASEKAQTDAKTLSWVVEELKKMMDQLTSYVPSLETQVETLNDTIADLNTELRARELGLERTTAAKEEFSVRIPTWLRNMKVCALLFVAWVLYFSYH